MMQGYVLDECEKLGIIITVSVVEHMKRVHDLENIESSNLVVPQYPVYKLIHFTNTFYHPRISLVGQ